MRNYCDQTVADRQSLRDLVVQEYGGIEELFRLVDDNPGITTLDAELTVGQVVRIQQSPSLDKPQSDVMAAFRKNRIRVANGNVAAPGVPGNLNARRIAAGSTPIAIGNIRLIAIQL